MVCVAPPPDAHASGRVGAEVFPRTPQGRDAGDCFGVEVPLDAPVRRLAGDAADVCRQKLLVQKFHCRPVHELGRLALSPLPCCTGFLGGGGRAGQSEVVCHDCVLPYRVTQRLATRPSRQSKRQRRQLPEKRLNRSMLPLDASMQSRVRLMHFSGVRLGRLLSGLLYT